MKQRLDAMIAAANAVRPALEDFYAALTDEQKAKFNRLGRQIGCNRAVERTKFLERAASAAAFLLASRFCWRC